MRNEKLGNLNSVYSGESKLSVCRSVATSYWPANRAANRIDRSWLILIGMAKWTIWEQHYYCFKVCFGEKNRCPLEQPPFVSVWLVRNFWITPRFWQESLRSAALKESQSQNWALWNNRVAKTAAHFCALLALQAIARAWLERFFELWSSKFWNLKNSKTNWKIIWSQAIGPDWTCSGAKQTSRKTRFRSASSGRRSRCWQFPANQHRKHTDRILTKMQISRFAIVNSIESSPPQSDFGALRLQSMKLPCNTQLHHRVL